MKDKAVQIRPWLLADSDFVMDGSQPLDPRKTIFVGGVPRPLRAGKSLRSFCFHFA
jgi:cytoplasmic polyadenylation element-binding protein